MYERAQRSHIQGETSAVTLFPFRKKRVPAHFLQLGKRRKWTTKENGRTTRKRHFTRFPGKEGDNIRDTLLGDEQGTRLKRKKEVNGPNLTITGIPTWTTKKGEGRGYA